MGVANDESDVAIYKLTSLTFELRHSDRAAERSGRLSSLPNRVVPEYNSIMSFKDIEVAVLKLVPKDRARLAGKLLESLENLSDEENETIWGHEAERRDAAWTSSGHRLRSAKSVLRRARAKLGK
jgi:hypothetical protein